MNETERRLRRAHRDVWFTRLFAAISAGLVAWGVAWFFWPPADVNGAAGWVLLCVLIGGGVALGLGTVWFEGTRQTRIGWWSSR